METTDTKVDKRSKEYRESQKNDIVKAVFTPDEDQKTELKLHPHTKLLGLFNSGIPLSACTFHSAVNNADNIPETFFSETSNNKTRRVEMALMPNGSLICRQGDRYFGVGTSTINFYTFKV